MDAGEFMEEEFGPLTFGRILKADRLAREWRQKQLAEKAGISMQAISSFERGREYPSAETAKRLAKALNSDPVIYAILIVQDMAAKKGFHNIQVSRKRRVELSNGLFHSRDFLS